jgi:UDP-2,3-diacylglucosamine hydrolase
VKPVLFISDLHLSADEPATGARFKRFLREEARQASALYILGDLFEYWLGDDDAETPFHRELLDALAALRAAGVEVSVMHGNRDFLLSKAVAARGRLTLLDDPTVLDVAGVRTLLMHGDSLCTDDVGYQRYRAWTRWPAGVRVFLALPRAVRQKIGQGLRRASERGKRMKAAAIMDVNADAVAAALRAHHYPRFIHGHTHRPGRHVHRVDGHDCERWVLGDWYDHQSYLLCDERGCEAVALS